MIFPSGSDSFSASSVALTKGAKHPSVWWLTSPAPVIFDPTEMTCRSNPILPANQKTKKALSSQVWPPFFALNLAMPPNKNIPAPHVSNYHLPKKSFRIEPFRALSISWTGHQTPDLRRTPCIPSDPWSSKVDESAEAPVAFRSVWCLRCVVSCLC